MTRRLFLVGLIAPALAACAGRARLAGPASPAGPNVQRGLASWYGYGDGFHGKRTASGERFDMNRLTAAHRDLPFGTRIQVRNLRNDRRVDVTVNDRLPPATSRKGRVLDVSYGAAKKLRMVDEGVVPVELTVRARPSRG